MNAARVRQNGANHSLARRARIGHSMQDLDSTSKDARDVAPNRSHSHCRTFCDPNQLATSESIVHQDFYLEIQVIGGLPPALFSDLIF